MALCASENTIYAMTLSSAIILAVLLDHWLGEPKKHHPLVAFGNLANRMEKQFNDTSLPALQQLLAGLLALLLAIAPFTVLLALLTRQSLFENILAPLTLYFCIAANSLKQHADGVKQHLDQSDLPNARVAVGYIVSRETDKMDALAVRNATIESILENGADAVFAPLFWFVAAGPAGALFYRLSNTLDAMWGYKTPRFLYFGRTAARLDDILNWLPARLTAFSYCLLGNTQQGIDSWRKHSKNMESPNAGPVMAAGAGALNIRLGGPAYYHGQLKDKILFGTDRTAQNEDIQRANRLINKTLLLWVIIISIGDFLA